MKLRKMTIVLLLSVFFVFGCHTIHLKNGNVYNRNYETSDFHHIFVFRLVEFSDPVIPAKVCSNGWDSVRTRAGFLQVLVGLFAGPVYYPHEVSIACKQ